MVLKKESFDSHFKPPTWLDSKGMPLGCLEKIKILNENIVEIQDMCQDALEDAVLMGCDEQQIRSVLLSMVESLHKPVKDGK